MGSFVWRSLHLGIRPHERKYIDTEQDVVLVRVAYGTEQTLEHIFRAIHFKTATLVRSHLIRLKQGLFPPETMDLKLISKYHFEHDKEFLFMRMKYLRTIASDFDMTLDKPQRDIDQNHVNIGDSINVDDIVIKLML